MIKMLEYFRLQNLETELEELETKILNLQKQNKVTRFDLKELEGVYDKISYIKLKIAYNSNKDVLK